MGTIFVIVGVAFLLSWIPALVVFFVARRRYSGDRIITCPETGEAEVVRLDVRRAASTSLAGEAQMRLAWCSRWPERRECGQECLAQVEAAPDGCLVRARLESWYAGARCCLCGTSFDRIQWFDRKPGLRSPDGRALSWDDVKSEELPALPALLSTHRPLCFNCLVAETFRQRFPDKVVDDPLRSSDNPGRDRTRPAA
jgi:hypothetical protein